ncbi:MAG: hypothetical protein MJ188_11200 [Treponema sp.]|nr:hypothetical protein [Treponema sp.]
MINLLVSDIDAFIKTKYRYRLNKTHISSANYIQVASTHADILLRYKPNLSFFPKDSLVFTNVAINPERKGTFANLIYYICNNCEKYGIKYIGLECCATLKSKNFAKKFGFIECTSKADEDFDENSDYAGPRYYYEARLVSPKAKAGRLWKLLRGISIAPHHQCATLQKTNR